MIRSLEPVGVGAVCHDTDFRYLLIPDLQQPQTWTIPHGRVNSYFEPEQMARGSVVNLSGMDVELTRDSAAGEVRAPSGDTTHVLLGKLAEVAVLDHVGPVQWVHLPGIEKLYERRSVSLWVVEAVKKADVSLGW